jgi:3'-5' exoribonuclease
MSDVPRRSVAELTPAERVEQIFLVSQPQLRSTNRGDYYIAAFLSDSTGKVNGRMWQASEAIYNVLPDEGFVWVKGRTENYQGALQVVIEAIKPVDIKEVDLNDFLPATEKNIEEMFARMVDILKHIQNPHLQQLIQSFLADTELMFLFRTAPAAIYLHHAYLGGLLEHTLALMEMAQQMVPLYPELNADLILSGLFLHDIGKTTELDYDVSFRYSDQGRLMGHLVKGAILVEEKIKEMAGGAFPRQLADCLIHIIVSHHGLREYGCPILPATPEAYVVHYLDNIDSKINMTLGEIHKDQNKSNWTNYIKALDSGLFKVRI